MPEHQRHRDGDPHDRIQFCYQSGIKENRKRKIQNIFPTFLRIIFTWEGQMDIVMPNGQIIKYDLPAIYVENYTTDVIF